MSTPSSPTQAVRRVPPGQLARLCVVGLLLVLSTPLGCTIESHIGKPDPRRYDNNLTVALSTGGDVSDTSAGATPGISSGGAVQTEGAGAGGVGGSAVGMSAGGSGQGGNLDVSEAGGFAGATGGGGDGGTSAAP